MVSIQSKERHQPVAAKVTGTLKEPTRIKQAPLVTTTVPAVVKEEVKQPEKEQLKRDTMKAIA